MKGSTGFFFRIIIGGLGIGGGFAWEVGEAPVDGAGFVDDVGFIDMSGFRAGNIGV